MSCDSPRRPATCPRWITLDRRRRAQLASLVVAEQKQGKLQPTTLSACTAAKALGGPVTVLVAGHDVAGAAAAASRVDGVDRVLTADDPALEHALAEPMAALLAAVQTKCAAAAAAAAAAAGPNMLPAMHAGSASRPAFPPFFSLPLLAGAASRMWWRRPPPLGATSSLEQPPCWTCRRWQTSSRSAAPTPLCAPSTPATRWPRCSAWGRARGC